MGKKGKESSGRGQGFASWRPSTFINKLNASILAQHPFIDESKGYLPFSTNSQGHAQLTLLPFMGVYLNHEFIFNDVFKFNKTTPEDFEAGDCPKGFEQLVVNQESIRRSNNANEIELFSDQFYGFRNYSKEPYVQTANEPYEDKMISLISETANASNKFFDRTFQVYLDELVFIAVEFYVTIPEIQPVSKISKFNTYSSMFPTVLGNFILDFFEQADFKKNSQTAENLIFVK